MPPAGGRLVPPSSVTGSRLVNLRWAGDPPGAPSAREWRVGPRPTSRPTDVSGGPGATTDLAVSGDHGSRARITVFILGLVALGLACWLVRWSVAPTHASGDTFWYTRQALQLAGSSRSAATASAARFIVEQGRGASAQSWIQTADTIDPRYPAIFESRPVYPLVAAALVPILGVEAMVAAALLAGLAFAVALGLGIRAMTGSYVVGAVGVVVAYALPSGEWLAFLYADGWMLALWVSVIGLAAAFVASGRRPWMIAYALALAVLQETKSANGVVLIVAIAGVAVIAVVLRSEDRRRIGQLAMVGSLVVVAQLGIGMVVGAPGLAVTLQDYFTKHFSVPDVPDPLRMLLRRDASLLPRVLINSLADPRPVAAVAAGLAALAWLRTMTAAMWIAAAAATTLTVLIHPAPSEFPRLLAPIWISVAVGAAGAVAAGRSRIEAAGLRGRVAASPGGIEGQ